MIYVGEDALVRPSEESSDAVLDVSSTKLGELGSPPRTGASGATRFEQD